LPSRQKLDNSRCAPLIRSAIQPVQALSRVPEAELLDDQLLFPQPADGKPHRSRGKKGLADEVLLREATMRFQRSQDDHRRRRQILYLLRTLRELFSDSKDDPSWNLTTD